MITAKNTEKATRIIIWTKIITQKITGKETKTNINNNKKDYKREAQYKTINIIKTARTTRIMVVATEQQQ